MRIIKLNIDNSEVHNDESQNYLDLADFSFIWDLVNKNRIV